MILACQCTYLQNQYEIIKYLLENDAQPNQLVSNSPQHHHQHIPFRTPLIAYIKHANERRFDMRIIRLLINYGARVSFSRGPGLFFSIRSFFFLFYEFVIIDSVLRFLRRFQSNFNLIELLCDAAYNYQLSYISESIDLNEKTKKEICRRATAPCTLKNIARKQVRSYLSKKLRIDQAVDQLDLPRFLQGYLLFKNV